MAGDGDPPQGDAIRTTISEPPRMKGPDMPNEEWGTKRLCPTTGKRFYDLNKTPIVSPYTGEVVTIDTSKARTMVADAEDAQTKRAKAAKADDDEDLLLDDDDTDDDADLGDEVLDEDDDDDDVPFESLTDVAKDDD
jgi:uncharacterized protein (TIGR02300 family)